MRIRPTAQPPTAATAMPAAGAKLCLAAAAVTVSLASTDVWAQTDTTFHATGAVAVGYDTNITNQAAEPPDGVDPDDFQEPIADFTIQPVPGIAIFHAAPRYELGFTYNHPFIFYVRNPDANTSADNVAFGANYALTPTEELSTTLTFSRTNNRVPTQNADETAVQAQRGGGATLLTMGFAQALASQLSEDVSLSQAASIGGTVPVDTEQPPILTVTGSIGPDVRLGLHAVGVQLSMTYAHPFADENTLEDPEEDDVIATTLLTNDTYLPQLTANWRWDWTLEWGSQVRAGVAVPFSDSGEVGAGPTYGASILFNRETYAASLNYDHTYAANLLVGQFFEGDTVSINGSVPIYEPAFLYASASSGFAYNRVNTIIDDGDTVTVKTVVSDVGLTWGPAGLPSITARYAYLNQFDAPTDQNLFPNYDRHLVTLTAAYVFPPRDLQVPEEPRPGRVDRGDRNPLGPSTEANEQIPAAPEGD